VVKLAKSTTPTRWTTARSRAPSTACRRFKPRFQSLELNRKESIGSLEDGGGEDPGVIKKVKVYVASKRKIQVGDKMADATETRASSRRSSDRGHPYLPDGGRSTSSSPPRRPEPYERRTGSRDAPRLGRPDARHEGRHPGIDGVDEETMVDMMKKANKQIEDKTGEDFAWASARRRASLLRRQDRSLRRRTGNKFDQRVMSARST
jgi:hypothetical protein